MRIPKNLSVILFGATSFLMVGCNSTPTPIASPSPNPSDSTLPASAATDQKIDFASPPQNFQLNACTPLTLQIEDAGTSAAEVANQNVEVLFSFSDAMAYSDPACTVVEGSHQFQAGQETATVYLKALGPAVTLQLDTQDLSLIYNLVITHSVTASAGSAAGLTVTVTNPSSGIEGSALSAMSACVTDNLGNRVAQAGTSITMALSSNPTGATLSGTLTEATSANGCAVFSNLSINLPGAYTLIATDGTIAQESLGLTVEASSSGSPGASPSPSPSSSSNPSSGSNPSPSPSPSPTVTPLPGSGTGTTPSSGSVDCTNITNANYASCSGTDPSYCSNPSYANFAPCIGAYPTYCSGSSYSNTLACTGSNPSGTYCQLNPTAQGCADYCDVNPLSQGCPDYCDANPTAAGCAMYCDVNPTAQGCPDYCEFNPTGQGCADFCDANPTAQGCPDYCDANPTSQGCPLYCDVNPISPGCPDYCEFNPTAQGC
jgi:hypothetical protein